MSKKMRQIILAVIMLFVVVSQSACSIGPFEYTQEGGIQYRNEAIQAASDESVP